MILYPKEPCRPCIDRPAYRSDILALLRSGLVKHVVLGDTQAIYGTGKTTALAKLYYDLKEAREAAGSLVSAELKDLAGMTPIWLSLDNFSIFHSNPKIQDFQSLAAFKQSFDDYKRLLIDLGYQIDPEAFADLDEKLDKLTDRALADLFNINIQAEAGKVDVGALAKVYQSVKGGDVKIELTIENTEIILRIALENNVAHLRDEFLETFRPLSQQRKFVLFADDFCWIIDQPIGDWLLELTECLDNTITLVARTITGDQLKWDKDHKQELNLQPFNLDEVREYMVQRGVGLTDAQLEKVFKFSKSGHPLLVSLAGDLMLRLDRREAQDMDAVLDRLVGKPKAGQVELSSFGPIEQEELEKQIDKIIDELRDDIGKYDSALLPGLDVIALARRFDYDLLRYLFQKVVLDKGGLKDAEAEQRAQKLAHQMIQRIREYSVVQELGNAYQEKSCFRVHYIVRERMEKNLQASGPPEYLQRLHKYLSNYYQSKEAETMKQQAEYIGMFRMERIDWQQDMLEWLYHLLHLEERTEARLQLCKLYLQAFDWWGWYIAFDFCNDLLSIWGQTQPKGDLKLIQLLQGFQSSYPLGYDKHGQGDWKVVGTSMQNLVVQLKLILPPDQMNGDQRMVRGHLERYTAEAFRFHAPPDYSRAEAAYLKSLQYFDVSWNQAWIKDYLADLYLDWMNYLAASKDGAAEDKAERGKQWARESNSMALEQANYDQQDHELLSQNYRILGRIYCQQGQWGPAVQAFTRSIAHAYVFHFMEDNQDDYSYRFYQDTGEQVIQALLTLTAQGRVDIACLSAQQMRRLWENEASFYAGEILAGLPDDFDLKHVLSTGDVDQLRAFLLPLLPKVGTEGGPIDTGVTVSQMIGEKIENDQVVPDSVIL